MSFQTPIGWAARATFIDTARDHQIRLNARRTVRFEGNSEMHSTEIVLGCSCGWSGGAVKTAKDALDRYRARHFYRPVLDRETGEIKAATL